MLAKSSGDSSVAALILGVKIHEEGDEENTPELSTYINIAGNNVALAEGLYAELASQIQDGNFELVKIFAEVLNAIQTDLDVNLLDTPGQKQEPNKNDKPKHTLH